MDWLNPDNFLFALIVNVATPDASSMLYAASARLFASPGTYWISKYGSLSTPTTGDVSQTGSSVQGTDECGRNEVIYGTVFITPSVRQSFWVERAWEETKLSK